MQIQGAASNDVSPGSALLAPVPQEEQARADLYALIARLLLAPPDTALLASLGEAAEAAAPVHTDDPFDNAWRALAAAARGTSADAVREEFDTLFISIGVPRLQPFASLYVAGFLNEKPLAVLRTDLARLGLARMPGVAEMEDHLGALCETMRLLITRGRSIGAQQEFFDVHIAPWYQRCLHDLRTDDGAHFYACVASLAAAFLLIESEAFEVMEDSLAANY